MMKKRKNAKELGAYYTNPEVAWLLVDWAVRTADDIILDPSTGHGVFLEAACTKLESLKGHANQIFGVEIDEETHNEVITKFSEIIPSSNILQSDFFDVHGGPSYHGLVIPDLPGFDVIIGNPPFIRYHRWKGKIRKRAQERARASGVELNGLSSSWAPFIVHAASFLNKGGRLAMVTPGELLHASYALPVIEYLWKSFESITLITFEKRIFPDLSEDAVLLLCDRKGHGPGSIRLLDSPDIQSLSSHFPKGVQVNASSISSGDSRLIEYVLPEGIRLAYNQLKSNSMVLPLGKFADIGIGYVTGNNDFFHLTKDQATALNIPNQYLSKVVRSSRDFSGLFFTQDDHQELLDQGKANLLLNLANLERPIPASISDYLERGVRERINNAYKCRTRSPWYVVPNVYECDGFLTYMSGKRAQLIVNMNGFFAPNTLHVVRLKNPKPLVMNEIAIAWLTSLTALSTEIEGHSMGGGLLKLEPSEAKRTLLAIPNLSSSTLQSISTELDNLIRDDNWTKACERADELVLVEGLGLSSSIVTLLREGASKLQKRRYSR